MRDILPARADGLDLDRLLSPKEFAAWIGMSEEWVRLRLNSLPGVIRESRQCVRIHPRAYLAARTLKK